MKDQKTKMHFLTTGDKFPYSYFLGVMTALKRSDCDVKVWYLKQPDGDFFKDILASCETESLANEFREFETAPIVQKGGHDAYVAAFDVMIWQIVANEGGVIMGLDSLTLGNWESYLEAGKEMLCPLDYVNPAVKSYAMHGVIVREQSELARQIRDKGRKAMFSDNYTFGDAGIIPYLDVARANPDRISVAPFGICAGYNTDGAYYLFTNKGRLINPEAATIPIYATKMQKQFDGITEDYVEKSGQLYARLVREILTKGERHPTKIYPVEFFKKIEEEETPQAQRLAEYIVQHFEPKSIIDWGCASGLYLKPFQKLGIPVTGVDSSEEALDLWKKEDLKGVGLAVIGDMTQPIEQKGFDIALSLETLEHLPEEAADQAVKNICGSANTIIFTAAQPGQGGVNHINCQYKTYWDAKFQKNGFERDVQAERDICEFMKSGYHLGWFTQNAMVFTRKAKQKPEAPIIAVNSSYPKFRFHVVSLPHTRTNKKYNACAYTMKVYNFCKMMLELGHAVYHYGNEGSDVPCTEHIQIFSNEELQKYFGHNDWHKEQFDIKWDANLNYWQIANFRAAEAINKRKLKKDFVCLIGGACQALVDKLVGRDKTLNVEFGVGYSGIFAEYRVFESYCHMMRTYGGLYGHNSNGRFYDTVIPNYFDPEDFPYSEEKDDYFLFIGRLISRKGLQTAVETTKAIGAKLLIAGQGMAEYIPGKKLVTTEVVNGVPFTVTGDNFEYVGYADVKKRGELMSRAKAVFVPTYYIEPFGGVNVEAQMCGTPVITTDFGAFVETVLEGVTGFRCRTMKEFIYAAQNVGNLKPMDCWKWASENYSLDRVRWLYQAYFEQLYDLWDKGFSETGGAFNYYERYRKFYP